VAYRSAHCIALYTRFAPCHIAIADEVVGSEGQSSIPGSESILVDSPLH
jgi:hypothetical protein